MSSHRLRLRRVTALALVALVLAPLPIRAAAVAPAEGRRGMVASPERHASEAGVAVLRRGGNAIDAAVAVAFALGVTDGFHSGIGGGGFILIHTAQGETLAIDARETAPAAATADLFVREGVPPDASRLGALSVATPGLVLGLAEALACCGTMRLAEVLEPAIRLAADGFPVGPRHVQTLEVWRKVGAPERFPETTRIQLPPAGTPLVAGWRLVQGDLAESLREIARSGPDALYRGPLGAAIVSEVQKQGGLLTREDLAAYRLVRREPTRGRYRGLEVRSFPPPSSGGVALVEMLNILEGFDLRERGAGSSASLHLIAEAMKLAFADRAAYLGDPDFVPVPAAALVDPGYAARLRARIDPAWWRRAPWTWGQREVAIRVEGPGHPEEDGGTSHLSVADAAGNAVAITQTVNLLFGSGITVPGTGIVLNDEMDDFSVAPNRPNAFGLVDTTGANAVAPAKRPLSSMTPTIVLRDGRPFMLTGSPGGPRIITTTLLTILNVADYGMDVSEAVAAPRLHHQWLPDELLIERAIPEDVRQGLRERGHRVVVSERNWSSAHAIVIEGGVLYGASDPRSDGLALGF